MNYMKFYKLNKNYITPVLFFLLILIYSLNILNEKFEFYFLNNTNNLIIKYLFIIFLSTVSFFYFLKDKEYLKPYYYISYLFLFPFLINGLIGMILFIKGILCVFISYLLYRWINDKKNYVKIRKLSKFILILFLFTYFVISFGSNFFDVAINHSKDLGIIVVFLAFIIYHKINVIEKRYEFFLLLPSIIIFLYLNNSKTLFLLFSILVVYKIINLYKKKFTKLILLLLVVLSLLLLLYGKNIKTDKLIFYNNFERLIVRLDQFTSLRISRAINPCMWSEYRYFKSKTYNQMISDNPGFKNCPYLKNNKISLLPLNFLNYDYELYLRSNFFEESALLNLKKINNHVRDHNLDNSFAEYLRYNGVIFFFIFIMFLLYFMIRVKKKSIYLILILVYFIAHSGLYAPGNLMAIMFNILLYENILGTKNA